MGISEHEYSKDDEKLVTCITHQNEMDQFMTEIKILQRTQCDNRRFNLIIEVNEHAFRCLMEKEKFYICWCRCKVYEDYDIVRCFECNQNCDVQKYGKNQRHVFHVSGKIEITCPCCSENHSKTECKGN